MSVGWGQACALTEDGVVVCWGAPPRDVGDGGRYVQVTSGKEHVCALREDGVARCWGGRYVDTAQVPEGYLFRAIAAGGESTCGITIDGEVACWATLAEYGYYSFIIADAPAGNDWAQVAMSSGEGCALSEAGEITCFGQTFNTGLEDIPEPE